VATAPNRQDRKVRGPDLDEPVADVLIVGFGPVGAVLATLLGQHGRQVVVVERDAEPYPAPRAIAADDEVLRILACLPGMGDRLLSRLNGLQRALFVDRRLRVLADIAFGESDLGMPGLAFFHQPSLERDLRAGVATMPNVEVRLGHAVAGLQQDRTGVTVTLTDGARLRARYVVGCDGASSTVRALLGVGYGGATFTQPWLVVDVETATPLRHLPYFCYVCDPSRPAVTMPMPGGHRWEWMLLPGEDRDQLATGDSVRELLRRYVDPETVTVVRSKVYTFHARTADRWRVGRVLLAGDAAHCMPQFAGQGMGAGIRDAAALAWRLDEVVRGAADPRLLDQYESERRSHVEAMTDLALLIGRILQTTSPAASGLVRSLLRLAQATPLVSARLSRGDLRPRSTLPPVSRHGRLLPVSGRMLPNPRVRTIAGQVMRLDDLLSPSWLLLAEQRDPTADLDGRARAWLQARDVTALAVVRPGRLPAAAHLACQVVEDLDGTLLRLLGSARPSRRGSRLPGGVAVVRPDRFLLGVLPSHQLASAVHDWQATPRPGAGRDLRGALVRRLARPVTRTTQPSNTLSPVVEHVVATGRSRPRENS
jgi:3-(3-hydroxy-phenyl)propionate hydroxylase